MRISVLVTSYNRPSFLFKCLESLDAQTRKPDEIVVVCRPTDAGTVQAISEFEASSTVAVIISYVSEPGVIAATNIGLHNVTGDIVCFIDDDAVASTTWCEKISLYFDNPNIGGVGGRDISMNAAMQSSKPFKQFIKSRRVGRITWFGRETGNHDKGCPHVLPVTHLKGCNMAYRRQLIGPCDTNLMVDGLRYEVDYGFQVRKQGYVILYDPYLTVDHYVAPRGDGDIRDEARIGKFYTNCFNHSYVMFKNLSPTGKIAHLLFTNLIGEASAMGLLRVLTEALTQRQPKLLRYIPVLLAAKRDAFMCCFFNKDCSHTRYVQSDSKEGAK